MRDVSVRSRDGAMIPLTAIAAVNSVTGPDFIERLAREVFGSRRASTMYSLSARPEITNVPSAAPNEYRDDKQYRGDNHSRFANP